MYTDITGKETRYERDAFGRISVIADDMLTVGSSMMHWAA